MRKLSSSDAAKLLNVEVGASVEKLNKAWRRLARECHPDLHPGDEKAETRYKKLNAAYTVLSEIHEGARRMRGLERDIVDNEFDRWIKNLDPEKQEKIRRELTELEDDE